MARAPPSPRKRGEGLATAPLELPLPACGERAGVRGRASGVEEGAQFARAAGVLELAQRLRLDLTDTLAGHRELLADLFQCVVGVHADAEAHAQHPLLASGQGRQDARRRLAQIEAKAL